MAAALALLSAAMFALGTATISILGWERERPVVETWNEGAAPRA